jgi:hypothetical protein
MTEMRLERGEATKKNASGEAEGPNSARMTDL